MLCSNPSTGRISFPFIHLLLLLLWKRGFQRADGLGLGHQKLGGNFPAVRLGHRERAISCRKAWPPVMAATRTPLRVSNLPLDLRMELRGRSGLAIVVVVVDDAGQGQVQGDCVFLLSQIGAGGGRGRRDAALPEEDEEKKKEEITRLMCFACQTKRLNSTV